MAKRRVVKKNRPLRVQFDQGYVSSRDKTELLAGELVSGVGGYYKGGDPDRIWKEAGRTIHHTFSGLNPAAGLVLCQFDLDYDAVILSGADVRDRLVALVDDTLQFIDPVDGVLSGTYASGLGSDVGRLNTVHHNDKWYLATGGDRPLVLEQTSNGALRSMGMLEPLVGPTAALSPVATLQTLPSGNGDATYWWHWGYRYLVNEYDVGPARFTVGDTGYIGNFTNISGAYDGNTDTYAYAKVGDPTDPEVLAATERGGAAFFGSLIRPKSMCRVAEFKNFPSDEGSNRFIEFDYQVVAGTSDAGGSDVGVGTSLGNVGAELRVDIYFDGAVDGEIGKYIPYPWLDVNQGTPPRWPLNGGGFTAYAHYAGDTRKSYNALFDVVNTIHQAPQHITFDIDNYCPANYNISGMRVVVSIAPYGASSQKGFPMSTHGYSRVDPVNSDINKAVIPTNQGMKPTVLRVYNMRVIDGVNSVQGFGDLSTISGVRYAVTEWDANTELESVPTEQTDILWFEDRVGAVLTISGAAVNANATEFNIYRSNMGGVFTSGQDTWANFGRVGKVKVKNDSVVQFIDTFTNYSILDLPPEGIATINIVEDNSLIVPKLRDYPPGKLRNMTFFKGSVVGTTNDDRRALQYSYQGYPEAFPKINILDNLPMKENDILVAPVALDNVIVILTRGGVRTAQELPHVRLGRLVASDIDTIEGAPGCVGDYAYTELDFQNFPAVAYVSLYGVYVCDGHASIRISEDLDWENEVNVATLYKSSLFFDKSLRHLTFIFDKDGDGANDTKFIFHMDPRQKKKNGQPKITGPTPAKIVKMVGGQVGNSHKVFSIGSATSGCYVERSGTADAANSWSGGTNIVPFSIMTGRVYSDWEYFSALRGNLRHTNWGDQNITMNWLSKRDDASASVDTTSKSVALAGDKGSEFLIGRNGEWHQCGLTHLTSGAVGGIHHLKAKIQVHGSDAGDT